MKVDSCPNKRFSERLVFVCFFQNLPCLLEQSKPCEQKHEEKRQDSAKERRPWTEETVLWPPACERQMTKHEY